MGKCHSLPLGCILKDRPLRQEQKTRIHKPTALTYIIKLLSSAVTVSGCRAGGLAGNTRGTSHQWPHSAVHFVTTGEICIVLLTAQLGGRAGPHEKCS